MLQQIKGGEQAEIIAESRGTKEDQELQLAYRQLLVQGPNDPQFGSAAEYRDAFPNPELMIRKKYQNIAGLQIADIAAVGQKLLTIKEDRKAIPKFEGTFDARVNEAIAPMVIMPYGRYMLE